jgi:hypothetical protein
LPHFILAGAPKCGTTTLHALLAQDPQFFLPEHEVFFFDVDAVLTHPDFFVHKDGLSFHDYDADFERYLAWYRAHFDQAAPGQILGEDTTTYLRAREAPRRIAELLPDVKILVMLRDPVARAYSQYWHGVRAGRYTLGFERSLRVAPEVLLDHGFYVDHLRRYADFRDAGQLKVILLEDFLSDVPGHLRDIGAFLGATRPISARLTTHANAARPPLHLGSRLMLNHLFGDRFAFPRLRPNLPGYAGPDVSQAEARPLRWYERAAVAMEQRLPTRRPPPMAIETRAHLERIFAKPNGELAEWLGRDLALHWACSRSKA